MTTVPPSPETVRQPEGGASLRAASCSPSGQTSFLSARVLVWFSCGVASACAAKLAADKYGDELEILYCDTLKYEHPDNVRFMRDMEQWLQRPIKILRSKDYTDIFDVFDKTGWLVGVAGARCTTELKKNVRKAYQNPEDVHIFGLTADEPKRITDFEAENPDIWLEWNLRDAGMKKRDCHLMVSAAGVRQPMMYEMGYKNNNCIGCVKGQAGYWNKIRVDFPEAFARMAAQERKMGVAICKNEYRTDSGSRIRIPVYLDELRPTAGRYEAEEDIECGPQCRMPRPELPVSQAGPRMDIHPEPQRPEPTARVSGEVRMGNESSSPTPP